MLSSSCRHSKWAALMTSRWSTGSPDLASDVMEVKFFALPDITEETVKY